MLKKLTQQATDLILHSIASGEVMGANFLITKGNEELVYAQAGMADREAEKPIERNTIFRLYSMTKPVTAVAAMILMERGMLDLYEPVADILPAFAHQKVERDGKLYTPERPILMHDLLAMTSGLVYPEEQTMGGRAVTKVFEEACARLESDHPVSTQEMAKKLRHVHWYLHLGQAGSMSANQQQAMQQWIGLEGYTYANFMRRCVAPELQQGICVKGEYGWDGWLGAYFANLPEQDITILMGSTEKRCRHVFPDTPVAKPVSFKHSVNYRRVIHLEQKNMLPGTDAGSGRTKTAGDYRDCTAKS